MHDSELLTELARAKRDREKAKEAMSTKRGELGEARQEYKAKCQAVEEILEEVVGERPLLAEIARKGAAAAPATEPPPTKRKRGRPPKARLAGLELPTAKETIQGMIGPEFRMLDALGLEWDTIRRLEASGIKTVGDLAGDKCPPGFEREQILAKSFLAQDVESPALLPQNAPESKPGPAKAALPPKSNGEPYWVEDDVDRELIHAVMSAKWVDMIQIGGTNEEIRAKLTGAWPKSLMFFDKRQSGGRTGYTITGQAGEPRFWIGAYLGPDHQPTLEGEKLIARVRKLLEIPTPTQADRTRVAQTREPVITAEGTGFETPRNAIPKGSSVPRPVEGWDSASIANAAEDLGVKAAERLAICAECGAARASGLKCHCGHDGWQMGIEFFDENRKFSQPRKAATRASKRA